MEKILRKVYSSKKINLTLKTVSYLSAIAGAFAFVGIVIYSYFNHPLSYSVKMVFAAAVPFVIVSIFRKMINAPRPYELYDFYEKKPKDKKGQSFPSRHVFSAFVIATLSSLVSVPLAAALAVLALSLAVARVLLGMHFIRDVAAGAIIGILSGVLGIVIIL